MGWWADCWNSIAQFFGYDAWLWGSAADWFAAIGTVGAVLVALVIFQHGRYMERRKQADDFNSLIYPGIRGGAPAMTHLFVNVVNNGSVAIEAPLLYVPLEAKGKSGFQQISLFGKRRGALAPGESVQKIVEISDVEAKIPRVLVTFRDSRNQSWLRYVDSAKYIHGTRRWWVRRTMRDPVINHDSVRDAPSENALGD